MRARGKERREAIWFRDAEAAETFDAVLFVGLADWYPPVYDCGAFGYATCAEFMHATNQLRRESQEPSSSDRSATCATSTSGSRGRREKPTAAQAFSARRRAAKRRGRVAAPVAPRSERDTVSPANRAVAADGDASRDVARVVSDVSVLCPRLVADAGNADASAPRRGYASETALKRRLVTHPPESPYRSCRAPKARMRTCK